MRYGAMLAATYNEAAPIKGAAIISPKLDGWRALWQDGKLYTRKGNELRNPPEVINALREYFPGLVLDGELCGSSFRDIASTAGTHDRTVSNADAVYWVFDIMEHRGKRLTGLPLRERLRWLTDAFSYSPNGHVPVALLDWDALTDPMAQAAEYKDRGQEGGMIKLLSSGYYAGARSSSWQKVKFSREFDGVVIGALEGDGRLVGNMGKLLVRCEDGTTVKVGGGKGLTDEVRAGFWARHQAGTLNGSKVTVIVQDDNSTVPIRFGRLVLAKDVRERSDV